ncbi:MAG: glycosyltransferase family 2 protein [Anaerolineales bacterium]|nr:glycosyltransferase family 2 protein [Anaerolineales bacterium]
MPTKTLSAIVVTHNHAHFLARCLDSLVPEVMRLGGEIIVVDNCSDDASAAIARRYPEIYLHVNQDRQGFAANSNYGMALAEGRYLLLLNPDTEVLPGALENLVRFMDNHPDVGLCGARLLFPNGQTQPSSRRFPTLGSFIARRTPLRVFMQNSRFNRRHLMLNADHSQPQPVDWLLGACLFVRRKALEEIGPLDEGYFLYVEDIDWARRMHQAGWKVYYVPTAQMIHHHLAVSDKHFLSQRTWVHTLSMLRYIRKFLLPPIPWLAIQESKTTVWNTTKKEKGTPF